ncbi:MAG: hypothetical protein QF394_01260 [Rhodospirillales bacterium]|nr:hypothetical protein [Rhodospirillales bacterium]MDP7623593.1 hypothetical protein [Rhodospirillales bacterium]
MADVQSGGKEKQVPADDRRHRFRAEREIHHHRNFLSGVLLFWQVKIRKNKFKI